ncbi:TPA: sugar nucleotide-binding protein [Streptococcus suis]|nr:sugar nucleotide-binding protein [Streptococcus suis]
MGESKMKFLILGCNGMAGHIISLYLKEQGYDVLGVAREKSKLVDSIVGDVTDTQFLTELIGVNKFDTIINCVGLLNEVAENNHSEAVLINAFLPHFLAKLTANTKTQIIQMSTDCVFSGAEGSYTEDSVPNGTLFYDKSKALGELEDDKNITLRNSIVGPDINVNGIGLLNWFLKQNDSVKGFEKAIWTGQTTLQLAKTMEQAALRRASGLYNAVPDHSINKYELLKLFNTKIRKTPIDIQKESNFVADKSLVRTRFEGFDYQIPSYETMVEELAEWMREHKDLYPHYDL